MLNIRTAFNPVNLNYSHSSSIQVLYPGILAFYSIVSHFHLYSSSLDSLFYTNFNWFFILFSIAFLIMHFNKVTASYSTVGSLFYCPNLLCFLSSILNSGLSIISYLVLLVLLYPTPQYYQSNPTMRSLPDPTQGYLSYPT